MDRSKASLPTKKGKRLTVEQRFVKYHNQNLQLPRSEQKKILEDIDREFREVPGIRYHSPETQAEQDYHLQLYQEWVASKHGKEVSDYTPEELEALAFPGDNVERMCEYFGKFLEHFFCSFKPASKSRRGDVTYPQLDKVGDSLSFWGPYKQFHRHLTSSQDSIRSSVRKAMDAIIEKYPNGPGVKADIYLARERLEHSATKQRELGLKNIERMGIKVVRCPEPGIPEPVPGYPGMSSGGGQDDDESIPPGLAPFITSGPDESELTIPEGLESVMTSGAGDDEPDDDFIQWLNEANAAAEAAEKAAAYAPSATTEPSARRTGEPAAPTDHPAKRRKMEEPVKVTSEDGDAGSAGNDD